MQHEMNLVNFYLFATACVQYMAAVCFLTAIAVQLFLRMMRTSLHLVPSRS